MAPTFEFTDANDQGLFSAIRPEQMSMVEDRLWERLEGVVSGAVIPLQSKRPRNAGPGPLEVDVRYGLVVISVVPAIILVIPVTTVSDTPTHEKMVTAVVGGTIHDPSPEIDRKPVGHVIVVVRPVIGSSGVVGLIIDTARVVDMVRNPPEDLLVPPMHVPADPVVRIVTGQGLGGEKRENRDEDPEDGKRFAKQFHGVTSCAGRA
jgi:hypothetical protein